MIINFDPPSSVEVYIERRDQSGNGVIRGPNGVRETIHVVSLVPYGVAGSELMRELRSFRGKEQLLIPPPRVDPTLSSVCSITDVITHCARAASLVSDVRTEVCHAFSPHTSRLLAQAATAATALAAAATTTATYAGYEDLSYSQCDDSSAHESERARRSSEVVDVDVQYAEQSPHSWYKHDMIDATNAAVDSHAAVYTGKDRDSDSDRDRDRERERERESSRHHSSYSSSSSSYQRSHLSTSSSFYPSHPSSSSSSPSYPSSSTTNYTGSNTAENMEIGGILLPEDLKSPVPVHPVIQHYSTPSGFTVDLNSANAVLSQVKNVYSLLFRSFSLPSFLSLSLSLSLTHALSPSLSLSILLTHSRNLSHSHSQFCSNCHCHFSAVMCDI